MSYGRARGAHRAVVHRTTSAQPWAMVVMSCLLVLGVVAAATLIGVVSASAKPASAEHAASEPAAVAPAAADDGTLSVTLDQIDGTQPWSADDTAGHDSGPDNGIARTNDTVSYDLGIRFEGATHTGTTIEFQIPKGQELVQLPPYCETGSSVAPANIPDPAVPLTGSSWQSLPRQSVSCVLKDYDPGQALNFRFVTSVRVEVPNGTQLAPIEFSVHSNEAPTPVTVADPEPVTVSAKADFDLSKRYNSPNNNGPIYTTNTPCPGEPTKACMGVTYPVTIDVPLGGKGTSPLQNGLSFVDDLSPEAFYGPTVWAKAVALAGSDAAARDRYAPMANCPVKMSLVGSSGLASSLPAGSLTLAGATTTNSVRESGTPTCNPAHSAGQPVTVTLMGTDTSALTVPTTTAGGAALPVNTGTIVSLIYTIGVPMAAIVDLGIENNGTFTLGTTNTFTDVKMKDLNGNPVVDDPANNTRQNTLRLLKGDGGLQKFFSGIWGQPGNTPQPQWEGNGLMGNTQTQGPPGSGLRLDGNTVVAPGQAVQSVLWFSGTGIPGTGTDFSQTVVGCDTWDPARLALAANPGWTGSRGAITPSNGKPVWVAVHRGHATGQIDPATINTPSGLIDGMVVEYSSGAFGAGQDSKCGTGTWYTNPDNVPGVVKSTDAQGRTTWDGINRVRVRFNTQWPAGNPNVGWDLGLAIGMVVKNAGMSTQPMGNWASRQVLNGIHSAQDTTASGAAGLSTYNPATHVGSLGDRLWEGTGQARIRKYVRNPGTGQFTDTAVPLYSSGQNVTYRLNPSLSGDARPGAMKFPVTVEDCLPRYQVYASSKRSSGAAIAPQVVQMGAPAGAEITCPPNQQYIRWDLGDYAVGDTIDPVEVTADILDVARNATYSNVTVVASPADPSPVKVRTDDVQMQLVVPTGIKIAKTVDKPLIEVNPVGVTTPRTLTWSVFFANIDGPPNVADVDVIDVLPDNSVAGNAFTGQLLFDKATVATGDNMTIHYTKTAHAAIALDPRDASNDQSTGTTVWCDAPSGGTVTFGVGTGDPATDCPASTAEVTGVRVTRPGAFNPDDQFQVDITMIPVGNHSGDIYVNRTSGKVAGVTQSVGPSRREAKVIASTVGDRVWEDTDKNGLQDEGEPGIPGWPVRLVGTDLDGNPVDLSTVTDANGNYRFTELASGSYKVVFDPTHLNVNSTFTTRDVDSDSRQARDSDADRTTGATEVFDLGPNTVDDSWDAGVVVDRNVDIRVDKRLVTRTPLDENNNTTVTYDVVVTNSGTAQGTYDLDDELKYGKGISITKVAVANTTPGSISTTPGFNGTTETRIVSDQVLGGGESHVYRVSVDAHLATKVSTTDGDCQITTGETGTGFLNAATVAADGKTSEDVACETVPPTKSPDLSINKELTYATPLDKDHRATVAYRITVANSGDGTGTYDLSDEIQYSGAVAVDGVKVSNTKPGGISVNPGFDGESDQVVATGQRIRAGESHQYVVTARVQVSTALTVEQADCKLTTKEQGTGYLNEARLEVNGTEVTDTACAPVPTPPDVGGHHDGNDGGNGILPSTGGPVWWLAIVGILSVVLGAVLVARRKQPRGHRPMPAARPEGEPTA